MALLQPLMIEFKRVSAKTTSPTDVILALSTSCPDQIRFSYEIENDKTYVATFSLEAIGKQFTSGGVTLDKAIESAASKVYKYLKVAEGEEEPDSSGLLAYLCSSSGDMDEEAAQLEIDVRRSGFDVEHECERILDDNYDIIYKCTIAVPDVGVFTGQSPKRHQGYKKAATMLKDWYQEEFEKKQKLSSSEEEVEEEDELTPTSSDQHFEGASLGGDDGNTLPETPSMSPRSTKTTLASLLQVQSASLMTLLNRFNSVYNPDKSPTTMMKELISQNPDDFSISTTQNAKTQFFTTTLKAFNLSAFEGLAKHSEKASREKAMFKQIKYLYNLTRFFALFRKLNTEKKPKEQIIEELLDKDCTQRLQFRMYPPRPSEGQYCWKTNIHVINLFNISRMSGTKENSRRSAAIATVEQLERFSAMLTISKYITAVSGSYPRPVLAQDESPVVVPAETSPKLIQGAFITPSKRITKPRSLIVSSSELKQLQEVLDMPELGDAGQQRRPSMRDIRLIRLLNDFNSVYDLQKSPGEVMADLLAIDNKLFEVITRQEGDEQHLTTLDNADLGVLFSHGKTKADSKAQVLEQAFTVLLRLNALVADFISLYSPTAPPIDYISILIARNPNMITFRVYEQPSGADWQASLGIQHLQHFNSSAKTRVEVIRAIFRKVSEFLVLFAERIHRKIPPRPVPTKAEAGDVVAAVYKHNRERIELLNGFISIYDPSKVYNLETMRRLIEQYPEVISISTSTKKHKFLHTELELKKLQTFQINGDDSHQQAMLQAFRLLNNFAFLFRTFQMTWPLNKSAFELLEDLQQKAPGLIKIQSEPAGQGHARTIINIVNFTTFTEHDETVEQSKAAAAIKAIEWFKLMAGWLRWTNGELKYMD